MNIENPAVESAPAVAEAPATTEAPVTTPTVEAEPEIDFTSDYVDSSELDQYDFPEERKIDPLSELTKKLESLEKKITVKDIPEEDLEEDTRTKKTKSKIDFLIEKIEQQEQKQRQQEIAQVENRIEAVNQNVLKAYTEKRLSPSLRKSFDVEAPSGIYASNFILADLVNMVEEFEAEKGRLIRPKETHAICEQHWKKHASAMVGNYKTRAASGSEPDTTPSDSNGNRMTRDQLDIEKQLVELSSQVDRFHKMGAVERQNHKKEIDEVNVKIKGLIDKKRLYKN
jgi:hypothetical protein